LYINVLLVVWKRRFESKGNVVVVQAAGIAPTVHD